MRGGVISPRYFSETHPPTHYITAMSSSMLETGSRDDGKSNVRGTRARPGYTWKPATPAKFEISMGMSLPFASEIKVRYSLDPMDRPLEVC